MTRKSLILLIVFQFVSSDLHEYRLLKDLLVKYNPLERPVANNTLPVVVTLRLSLQQLINLDAQNQIIEVNAWLKYTWSDYKLIWDPMQYGGIADLRFPLGTIWKPDVLLYNSADSGFDSTYKSNLVVYNDGSVNWIPPGLLKSSCKMDITWFPFDDQSCHLKFGSWTYHGFALNLQPEDGGIGIDTSEYLENDEWILLAYPLLTFQASIGQQIGMAAIAVNRYMAICRFQSHEQIWQKNVVIVVILSQFLCPLPFAVCNSLWGQIVFPMDNNTGVIIGKPYYRNIEVQFISYIVLGFMYLLNNLLMLILYGLIVKTLRQHLNQVVALGQTSELTNTDKKMVSFGLSLFLMNLTFMVMSVLAGSVSAEENVTMYTIVTSLFLIVGELLAYCNPWFMLLFSKKVRKHFLAIVRCKPPPE